MQTTLGDVCPVSEQIAEAQESYPQSIALTRGGQQLSYADLNCRADQFAGHLKQLGVVPGGTVAICMDRSFEWIVAALGIMRAGAAYVPLDSSWPDSRLYFAVNDSGATVLVAREPLLRRLKVRARGIDPSRDTAAIAGSPKTALRPVEMESLAYVIYTSGSTGVPKGVEITHANLAHLVRWHRNAFGVTRQDRATHLAGLGFDAAVWELWPHLAAGATVYLADDAERSSAELMQQWLVREKVTIAFVPTLYAQALISVEWPSTTKLRFLLTGGDVLHHAPRVGLPFEVVNNYGPTECTVVATSTVIKSSSLGVPSIGRPIADTIVYLLNERGELVPEGSPGEIYISGKGVGRGYRNLPKSTERSFLPDPFRLAPGFRMYRTGDRGVLRPDGEIEFRGRLDRQTKVRGQRIELDEISSILSRHPSLEFATAIAKISELGENELVAYVLPKKNAWVPTAVELKRHLLQKLPEYMIPVRFVGLRALPLSANGKIDLTMLTHLADANLLKSADYSGPVSLVEERLLTVVRELLNNDEVVAQDNFFFAGGHSLLGMQLVMRVRETFGVDVSLQQLFEAPSVANLALLIEVMLAEARLTVIWADLLGHRRFALDDNFLDLGGDHPQLVSSLQQRIASEFGQRISIAELCQSSTIHQQAILTQKVPKVGPVLPPGVLALQSEGDRSNIFWVHYVNGNLAKAMGEDQPFTIVTLTVDELLSLGAEPSLESIAAVHVRKILAVQTNGPYIIGGQCLGGILAYEIACQLQAGGLEVSDLVLLDTPNLSYLESHLSLRWRLNYLRYLRKRARQLGLRSCAAKLRVHLLNRFSGKAKGKSGGTEMHVVQEIIEAAACAYEPLRYEGKVLFLSASERPAHVDFLAGWREIVSAGLHAQFVDGCHAELLNSKNVQSVADAIRAHIGYRTKENTGTASPICNSIGLKQTAKSAKVRRPTDSIMIETAKSTNRQAIKRH